VSTLTKSGDGWEETYTGGTTRTVRNGAGLFLKLSQNSGCNGYPGGEAGVVIDGSNSSHTVSESRNACFVKVIKFNTYLGAGWYYNGAYIKYIPLSS